MDHFGIGAALHGAARIYFQSGRQTGRTTSLLQSLKDGDRIIVPTTKEQLRLTQLTKQRGLKVEVFLLPPDQLYHLREIGTSLERTIFEHTWVEMFYLQRLEDASKQIDEMQKDMSGWGEAHEETRQRAVEIARWRI